MSRKWKNLIVASALTARAWEFPLAQSVERWTPLPEVHAGFKSRHGYVIRSKRGTKQYLLEG